MTSDNLSQLFESFYSISSDGCEHVPGVIKVWRTIITIIMNVPLIPSHYRLHNLAANSQTQSFVAIPDPASSI